MQPNKNEWAIDNVEYREYINERIRRCVDEKDFEVCESLVDECSKGNPYVCAELEKLKDKICIQHYEKKGIINKKEFAWRVGCYNGETLVNKGNKININLRDIFNVNVGINNL